MGKNGGRPKRFSEEGYATATIQMPVELAKKYEAAATALGLSKSRFGQYLFEKWLEDQQLDKDEAS